MELSLEPSPTEDESWTLHVDGSSNTRGSGARFVLKGPGDTLVEQLLHFDFKTTNNKAEYEALMGEFQVKDPLMMQYFHKVTNMLSQFQSAKI